MIHVPALATRLVLLAIQKHVARACPDIIMLLAGEEKVGVGLSVLLPDIASSSASEGQPASAGSHLPVVETVTEGSPAHVDGRIVPGSLCASEHGCECLSMAASACRSRGWFMTHEPPGDVVLSIDPSGSGLRHTPTDGKTLDEISSLVSTVKRGLWP